LVNGASFAFSRRTPSPLLTVIEQTSKGFIATLEQFGRPTHDPIELQFRFPSNRTGLREPLLTTGNLVGNGDILYVSYLNDRHVQFGFFHLGVGGPPSEPIPIDYAAEHTLTPHLGSLYPPHQHPLFRSWREPRVNKIRRRLDLILDGRSVLQASVNVYTSTPDGVHIGANALAPDVTQPRFTDPILASRRLGAEPPTLPAVRPTDAIGLKEPLLSTGTLGAADIIYVHYLDATHVQFGVDHWGEGTSLGPVIEIDPAKTQDLTLALGSLFPPAATPPGPAVPPMRPPPTAGSKSNLAAALFSPSTAPPTPPAPIKLWSLATTSAPPVADASSAAKSSASNAYPGNLRRRSFQAVELRRPSYRQKPNVERIHATAKLGAALQKSGSQR